MTSDKLAGKTHYSGENSRLEIFSSKQRIGKPSCANEKLLL
jgi:hypothetical protein